MIYPDNIEEKLGFDVIRQQLSNNCHSELGKKLVNNIQVETNITTINLMLDQIHEFDQLLQEHEVPAIGQFTDILPYLAKSKVKGHWLGAGELFEILTNMSSALQLAVFIAKESIEYPSLSNLNTDINGLKPLENSLLKTVNKEGEVLNTASRELKKIRHRIISEVGSLRKVVNVIFKKAKADGIIPDGATIGVRDGRMVIPVTASSKKQIQGFVHDESASGNIVFLEPASALDANNLIRELQIAESREVRRILTAVTEEVGKHHDELQIANAFLADIDLLWAKTKVCRVLGGSRPQLSTNKVEIRELYHPLLLLQEKVHHKDVIPHDILLDDREHIMLISGPNAGGKSVALKSVGLNQMMLQAGILPCCSPDSEFKVFTDLFIDIGDEQSIDNDLSTYSSHLQNMSVMLKHVSKDSLILIDEFGSGTDPVFGGAIAEAVLYKLNKKGCYGIITTHFSNLKLYAEKEEGVTNAAMMFDLDNLTPLYQLQSGRPGSSFSLEVARHSGLPQDVIEIAQKGIGAKQIDIERLLGNLEDEKRKLAAENQRLESKNAELSSLIKNYELLKNQLEDRQQEIITQARAEASELLAKTNREIEKTIRHIKENRAEKKETKKARESLQAFTEKVKPKRRIKDKREIVTITETVKKGDQALLIDNDVIVDVLEVKGKKAKVLIGELQSVIAINKLKKISKRKAKENLSSRSGTTIVQNVNKKIAGFSTTLDIRGVRAADLLPRLQRFLDEAVMLNQTNVKIIHGRGDGVLRKLVRDELKQWPQVISYDNEPIERGGDGATVVLLK
jgi:DNA mismatch repair protein MutS2